MKIDDLLEKYFEGETTCEEEQQLRRFFATGDVPEHLAIYRPLFACIDREAEAAKTTSLRKAQFMLMSQSILPALCADYITSPLVLLPPCYFASG